MADGLRTSDLSYVAAVLDNVGALRSRRYRGSVLPVVQVSGRYGSLEWLGQITGTKVIETSRKFSRHNCTEHCPDRHQDIESVSARWSITGMRATIVLANVLPFLRVRAAEARELVGAGLRVSYKGDVVNDMSKLGWSIPELAPHPRARVPLARAS